LAEHDNVILIKVIDDGDFHYQPSVKNVKLGQSVTWTCAQGPFSISFKDRTPFGRTNLHATKPEGSDSWYVTSAPAKTSELGHFHYAVAIFTNDRVYLDAGCPEVILGT
jgi:plastocyanin